MMVNLFTLPEHRRKGYAKLVTNALCRKLLEKGIVPYVNVDVDNKASQAMHRSMGFRGDVNNQWVGFVPRNVDEAKVSFL